MKRAVGAVWGGTLVAGLVGVVPPAVLFLNRALNAARHIEQYTAEIQAGAAGIARNTAGTAALKDTIATAGKLAAAAEALERDAVAIEDALAAAPSQDGESQGEKA